MLGKTELLGGLDEESLERLAERAVERSFRKGQLLFYQGDPGESLILILEGMVRVFLLSEDGEEIVLNSLGPGHGLGDVALVDPGPRSASVEALEATRVLVLTRQVVLEELQNNPLFAQALLRSMGKLVRKQTEQTADLVFLDLNARVAKLLVRLAEDRGEESADGAVLHLALTQSDLARMVGGSRQSVNQILRSFERRGFIELQGRTLIVKRLDVLRRRAGI
jgi:CRP/FNR family cyclic AMP-dependent transcriptional regulator